MVIRRGDLDESLQKLLEIRLSGEPECFPRFVRLPESPGVEVFNSLQEVFSKVGFAHAVRGLAVPPTTRPRNFETSRPNLQPACRGGESRTSRPCNRMCCPC